jgi:hypothetical protein
LKRVIFVASSQVLTLQCFARCFDAVTAIVAVGIGVGFGRHVLKWGSTRHVLSIQIVHLVRIIILLIWTWKSARRSLHSVHLKCMKIFKRH